MTTERDDAYAERLAAFMRRKFPDFAARYDDFSFNIGVREGIREGRRWNVRTADGMVATATLWLIGGPEIFAKDEVKAFLGPESGGESIDRKMSQLIDRVWQTLDAEAAP